MNRTSVSIVMCVRDGERYLREAIDSLLIQSTPAHEIVVVDDGSSDSSPEILRSFGDLIAVITQPPLGIFTAMNRGIAHATGDVVGFLDADDIAPPESLSSRLVVLAADPSLDGVVGRTVQFVSPDVAAEVMARYVVDSSPLLAPSFTSSLFRRSLLDRVGQLDETLRTGSTIDWISRAKVLGMRLGEVDDVVLLRRVHGGNIGAREPEATRQNLLAVVRAHHRRAHGPES